MICKEKKKGKTCKLKETLVDILVSMPITVYFRFELLVLLLLLLSLLLLLLCVLGTLRFVVMSSLSFSLPWYLPAFHSHHVRPLSFLNASTSPHNCCSPLKAPRI